MRNTKIDHDPSFLGDLEREVMSIAWRLKSVTAEVVRENLSRQLKESTVRTVLSRLEKKGYLIHSVANRTYIYRAAETPRRIAAMAVRRLADWLCEGSMEELFVGMVDADVVDQKQLKRLSEKIARVRKEKK